MKNLKKALCLMLTFALSFTMFAGAVEFSDVSGVTNADAIKTMATLGIINGYTDGTFRPEETVTRAQMAKMIYVLKMGGDDDGAAYYTGISSKLTDIKGHWAEGYIKYCESLGIVAGYSDGSFKPDKTVTGLEAAKMLLIVQGYDAEKVGLVGNTWAVKTASLGADSEFFKNYGVQLDQDCPREYAALMMYNALDATYMTWDSDSNSYVKSTKTADTKTLGEKYMNLVTVEGVLLGAGEAELSDDGTTMGNAKADAGKGKISINVERVNDSIAPAVGTKDAVYTRQNTKFDCDDETVGNLLGQYVRATINSKKDVVLGVFAVDSKNTVVETTVNKVQLTSDADKVKIDGTTYKVEDDNQPIVRETTVSDGIGNVKTKGTTVYEIGDLKNKKGEEIVLANVGTGTTDGTVEKYFKGTNTNALSNASKVRFIDNDGNGKFDIVLITEITAFEEVTNVASNYFTAGAKYYNADVTVNGTLKEGAYVARTYDAVNGKYVFDVVEPVEAEATAVKTTFFPDDTARVNGNWYYAAVDNTGAKSSLADIDGGKLAAGSTYKFYAVNNVIYVTDKVAAGSTDIALVTYVGAAEYDGYQTKLLLSNGTTMKVTAKVASTTTANGDTLNGDSATSPTNNRKPKLDTLVVYELSDDKDNEIYDLYIIDTTSYNGSELVRGGYGTYGSATPAAATNKYDHEDDVLTDGASTVSIDDDAVVFVKYYENATGDAKYKALTGKEVSDFSRDFGASYRYLADNDGFKDAKVVFLASDDGTTLTKQDLPGSAAGQTLAYALTAPARERINSADYTTLQIWTEKGEQTLKIKGNHINDISRGDAFYFDPTTEDSISMSNITFLSAPVAVTEITSSRVSFNGGSSISFDDDAVILTVSTSDHTGNENGKAKAAKYDSSLSAVPTINVGSDYYHVNARYALAEEGGTKGKVLFLVIDNDDKAWHDYTDVHYLTNGNGIPLDVTLDSFDVDKDSNLANNNVNLKSYMRLTDTFSNIDSNLTTIKSQVKDATVIATNGTLTYTYVSNGNKLELTEVAGKGNFTYDSAGTGSSFATASTLTFAPSDGNIVLQDKIEVADLNLIVNVTSTGKVEVDTVTNAKYVDVKSINDETTASALTASISTFFAPASTGSVTVTDTGTTNGLRVAETTGT